MRIPVGLGSKSTLIRDMKDRMERWRLAALLYADGIVMITEDMDMMQESENML